MQSLFETQQIITEQVPKEAEQLSDEQLAYIRNECKGDTKLIACAGSGKTKCMIERIRYLVHKQIMTKDQIMVFSYSKPVVEHMKVQCKKLRDHPVFVNDHLIKTIDSFSFDLLQKDEQQSVIQVLSVKARNLLQDMELNPEEHKKLIKKFLKSKYGKVKAIFVDEAQDLNQIQYDIVLQLKKIIGCTLHLIGDPNQNIYQFRQSFEKYLLNHPGEQFILQKNYRCNQSIDQFSQYFRYYNSQIPKQPATKSNVTIFNDTKNKNDQLVIQAVLELHKKQKIPLSDIAIISPTIGEQFNTGIIRMANLLNRNGIPTVNFYNEQRNQITTTRKTYCKRGGVNLMTVHASKGLEYHTVFLIKFQDIMLKSEIYDAQYVVSQNMNILYVALTRAKNNLFIVHDQTENKLKHICSITQTIPSSLYNCNGDLTNDFNLIQSKLKQRKQISDMEQGFVQNHKINEYKDILLITKLLAENYFNINKFELTLKPSNFQWRTSVTAFIQQLDQNQMLSLLDKLQYKKKCKELYQMSDQDIVKFNELRLNYEQYIGCLFELSDTITDTKLQQEVIIQNSQDLRDFCNLVFTNQPIDVINKKIDEFWQKNIITDEDKYLEREKHTKAGTAEFIQLGQIGLQQLMTLHDNSEQLFKLIDNFNTITSWQDKIPEIIYFTMIKFAFSTKHQKYLSYQPDLIQKFSQFIPIFEKMDQLSTDLANLDCQYQHEVGDDVIGFIDFLVLHPKQQATIIDLKVQNELSIENIVQILIYDLLLSEQQQNVNTNQLIIINCLKGVQYEFCVDNREELHNILTKMLKENQNKRIQ